MQEPSMTTREQTLRPLARTVVRVAAIALGAFACAQGLAFAQGTKAADDLAIVVHPSTPVSGLSFAELRQVFVGDRQYWTKDVPVVLLIRAPASAERDAVLKTIYQMTEPQFKQFWIAKIFRAETVTPPKIVYSSDSTNQLVEAVPGAIAFMLAKDVRPGLKVLRIDGHLPGEPGYRLHQRP
jgi:ABC-type phosphate transport system substrate-binding protein